MSIFKACDIRGVVGAELNEQVAHAHWRRSRRDDLRAWRQFGVLGWRFPPQHAAPQTRALTGLLRAGVDVVDVGQNPTPLVYFAADHLSLPNAVIVTASHNPGCYNGFKFMLTGQPAQPVMLAELQARMANPGCAVRLGQVKSCDLRTVYEEQVRATAAELGRRHAPSSTPRRLKVVLDAMGGACGEIAPRVLAAAGYNVIAIHCQPDPDLTRRAPNPAVEDNLSELAQCVVTARADLGIALDGDGDRAAFIDSNGIAVKPEQMGVLLIQHCFPQPKVVYDLKCASILAAAVGVAGGTCSMQPSGYGFIKSAMIEQQADLGVEVSGHYFFRAERRGRRLVRRATDSTHPLDI